MADFETREINPAGLFESEHFYRVPEYQRPFSWDYDEFDDLINDTLEADRGNNYFLGTVVFHKSGDGVKNIVDGQQRFTALMILIACLRDLLSDPDEKQEMQDFIAQKAKKIKGIPARVRLEVRDREIYNQIVVEEGGTNELPDLAPLTEPQSRYVFACDAFRSKLKDLQQNELSSFANFITTKCQFIYLSANTFEEAFRLFEVVNDRGKQLRRIDVLKALTISPNNIANDATRRKVALDWERAEDDVGEAIFEDIFFLMRLALVKDKPKGDLLYEFEERIFKDGLAETGEKFVDLVLKYVELYRALFIDRTALEETDWDNKFQSLIYAMDNEFRASEWRSCLLLYLQKFKKNRLYDFVLAIETLFLTHWVEGTRKDERYADYTRILRLITDTSSAEQVIAEVGGDREKVKAALFAERFYGRDYAKYILLRLELNVSDFSSPCLYDARSIEHVYPQTPKEGGGWASVADAATRARVVDQIGNLVLLSKSKNSKASNKEFAEKQHSYLNPRVTGYPRSAKVLGYKEWTPEIIEARSKEASEALFSDL